MPQVSRRYLPEEKLKKIFDLFFNLIVSLGDRNETEAVLAEFLTPTEKVMIAKRIACFYLIHKKVPGTQIADALKLSLSTVTHHTYVYENAKQIREFLSRKSTEEKIKNFFEDLWVEFFYGMPRKGANWGWQKKMYNQHKIRRQEPL